MFDVSDEFNLAKGNRKVPLTKLTFQVTKIFADEKSLNDYTSKLKKFKKDNDRDTHQEFGETQIYIVWESNILMTSGSGNDCCQECFLNNSM